MALTPYQKLSIRYVTLKGLIIGILKSSVLDKSLTPEQKEKLEHYLRSAHSLRDPDIEAEFVHCSNCDKDVIPVITGAMCPECKCEL